MKPHDRTALDVLTLAIIPPTHNVRLLADVDGRRIWPWPATSSVRALAEHCGRHRDVRLGVAGRRGQDAEAILPCAVLWAVIDSGRAGARLARMRPRPTLVLGEGDSVRRTALWALQAPLQWDWTVRANKRIAHFLGTPKKHAEPTHMIRPPGTHVRDRGLVPLPVVVHELNPDALYTPRAVVGHLRDAPPPKDWRNQKEAA